MLTGTVSLGFLKWLGELGFEFRQRGEILTDLFNRQIGKREVIKTGTILAEVLLEKYGWMDARCLNSRKVML